MTTKNEYLDKAKQQLDEWAGDLDALQAKTADAAGDLKAKYDAQMVELRAKLKEGEAKWAELKDSADDVWDDFKDEAEEKWAALAEGYKASKDKMTSLLSTKGEYLEKARQQLAEWQGDLEALQAKAADAAEDLKAKYEEQMAELRVKLKEGEGKWAEFKDSADEMWDDVKEDAEKKWTALTDGFKQSIDKVKSFFA